MKRTKLYPLIFPLFIVVFGLVIYKVFKYEPNFYTIILNVTVAFILSPRVKTIDTQSGRKDQITWLFFKRVIS